MQNPHFMWEVHLQMVHFPASSVSLPAYIKVISRKSKNSPGPLFMLAPVLGAREKTCIFENMLIIHFHDFLPKSIHNKSKATRLINDQIWEYLYSWQWRQNAGKDLWTNMQEVFAEWKKDAADSLLKFKRALNAGATLFIHEDFLSIKFETNGYLATTSLVIF